MFQSVEPAPPDAILGLTDAYRADSNPEKINLGVGVYQDAEGRTPVLGTVREAFGRLAAESDTMSYLPIPGRPEYAAAVQRLVFGEGHEAVESGRAVTSHTPGGTAALRVAADFLKQNLPSATVWLSQPTWANHPAVFAAAGVPTKSFPYFDPKTNGLAFDELLGAINEMPEGDVILLHGCCHNPTGADPDAEQWRAIADAVYQRKLLPLIDFAYQGFADGLAPDTAGVREFCRPNAELIVCSSFSKNFGLYRQRVGALTMIAADKTTATTVQSQVKRAIRANYSNPPALGADIVVSILSDEKLSQRWEQEVAEMRERINGMRELLVQKLTDNGAPGDYSFITRQRGMFSFTGLTPEQVDRLRSDHSIYMVGSGRINVAGITEANVDRLTTAIAQVLGEG